MPWQDRARRVSNALRKAWKRLLSYRKRSWSLSDYPIVVRRQKNVPDNSRYWARILGWNLDGLGSTRQDAMRDLEQKFVSQCGRRREAGEPMPRPGAAVPIQFASQARVSAQPELMEDFIHRVLGLPWAFISDESTLSDFHAGDGNDALLARIRDIYGVDVSGIHSGNIAEILERIHDRLNPSTPS